MFWLGTYSLSFTDGIAIGLFPWSSYYSQSKGIEDFHPPNGRKGLEGLRNARGTWNARHIHMTKPSQVTFHGHHFRAIMGFIMNGLAPRLGHSWMDSWFLLPVLIPSLIFLLAVSSKHLPDDWLERMFHSCQHRRPPLPDILDHPETHPLLMSQLVGWKTKLLVCWQKCRQ